MNNQILSKQFVEAQRRHHKGEISSALRVYDVLLRNNKNNKSVICFRLLALAQLGRGAEYENEGNEVLKNIELISLPDIIALSIFYKIIGSFEKQIEVLKKGKNKFPASPAIDANMGNFYLQFGKLDEAKKFYLSALGNLKDDVAIPLNLSRIEIAQGNYSQAEEYLSQAEKLSPGFPDISYLRAVISNHDCDYEEASKYLELVLDSNPMHRDAWQIWKNLPSGVINESKFDKYCTQILTGKVSDPSIIFAAYGICRATLFWNNINQLEAALNSSLELTPSFNADVTSVFTSLQSNLDPKKILNVARQSWLNWTRGMPKYKEFEPKLSKNSNSKIRIGYLSSDLRDHVVSRIAVGALELHNKNEFEIFAYSNFGSDGSEIRDRYNRFIDQWVNIASLNDERLAEKIKDDEIDILVDLNGITRGTRVRVFHYRPAPVQITWLGMPGSLGAASACDYIVVDKTIVDDLNKDGFDENFIFMPSSYVPVEHRRLPDLKLSRSNFGIPDGCFVYSVFSTAQKYHPTMIACWAEILRRSEDAVMLFLDHGTEINKRVRDLFKLSDINESRLFFLESLNHSEHLKRLTFVNCALETWPYGAGGTCVDIISVGVPIVTLKGSQFHTRVGSSIAHAAGLNSMIGSDFEEYINRALDVYKNFLIQPNSESTYSQKICGSGIYDLKNFISSLEHAYKIALKNYKSGIHPVDINI